LRKQNNESPVSGTFRCIRHWKDEGRSKAEGVSKCQELLRDNPCKDCPVAEEVGPGGIEMMVRETSPISPSARRVSKVSRKIQGVIHACFIQNGVNKSTIIGS